MLYTLRKVDEEALREIAEEKEVRKTQEMFLLFSLGSQFDHLIKQELENFGASFIAQGTLYTDISETGGGYDTKAKKAQIKLHHNVKLGFSVKELIPLSDCVKDSSRNIGRLIGVPEVLLTRHPFPGPGLLIRIEGEVTAVNLKIAREVDKIYIEMG